MPSESWLHPTLEFERQVFRLERKLGEAAAPVLDALDEAFEKLDGYSWDGSLDFIPVGKYGDSFAYRFHPGYFLIFRRVTERTEGKEPMTVRLFLKTIQRQA